MTLKPPCVIRARDLDDAWFQALAACVEKDEDGEYKYSQPYLIERGSYAGQERLEIDTVLVDISDPASGPLIPQMPQGKEHLAPTTMEAAQQYLLYLMTGEKQPKEQYTYGERLVDPKVDVNFRSSDGQLSGNVSVSLKVDQIKEVIRMYKEDGHGTNQACMEIGMPSDILLPDPPCLRVIDTRIRENMLHFIFYIRSWDLYNGFPVNLAGLQQLKHYMADEIGVHDGSIRACSKGLHLYDDMWPLAALRLGKEGV